MGQRLSSSSSDTIMAANAEKTDTTGEEKTFVCAVSTGSWTGINWRANPYTGARAANGSDWPRNGALLRGIPHEKDGKMYLEVNAIQQAGTAGFKDVRGQEKWMPSDGGSWNGGQWLHEPKE
jgi:hypothetical protein